MKLTFEAPPLTTLGSLESVARNVNTLSLEFGELLPTGRLDIEKEGDVVRWHVRDKVLVFSLSILTALELVFFRYNNHSFGAAALTFARDAGEWGYRLINSNESEIEWLRATLSDIAQLFGVSYTEGNIGEID